MIRELNFVFLETSLFLLSFNAYLPIHDTPFWKCQTKDNALVTPAADLGDNQTKLKNAYLPLHDISFWKSQIKAKAKFISSYIPLGTRSKLKKCKICFVLKGWRRSFLKPIFFIPLIWDILGRKEGVTNLISRIVF